MPPPSCLPKLGLPACNSCAPCHNCVSHRPELRMNTCCCSPPNVLRRRGAFVPASPGRSRRHRILDSARIGRLIVMDGHQASLACWRRNCAKLASEPSVDSFQNYPSTGDTRSHTRPGECRTSRHCCSNSAVNPEYNCDNIIFSRTARPDAILKRSRTILENQITPFAWKFAHNNRNLSQTFQKKKILRTSAPCSSRLSAASRQPWLGTKCRENDLKLKLLPLRIWIHQHFANKNNDFCTRSSTFVDIMTIRNPDNTKCKSLIVYIQREQPDLATNCRNWPSLPCGSAPASTSSLIISFTPLWLSGFHRSGFHCFVSLDTSLSRASYSNDLPLPSHGTSRHSICGLAPPKTSSSRTAGTSRRRIASKNRASSSLSLT